MAALNVGVIGTGAIAQHAHLPAYKDLDTCRLAALAEIDPDRAAQAAKDFGVATVYHDWREMLESEKLDIVSICTPNYLHAEMAVAVESARLLARRAAFPATVKGPDPLVLLAATLGKEVAMEVTGQAVRLHGGYGCTRDYAVGRYFRDAKTLSLAPPAMDAIKITAGKMLLGVPLGGPPG